MAKYQKNNYYFMSCANQNIQSDKAVYVIQSYFDRNNILVHQEKNLLENRLLDKIETLSCDEIKYLLLRDGLWPQYTRRIKNLEKIEQEIWQLYYKEIDPAKRYNALLNLAELQSSLAQCYAAARHVLEIDNSTSKQ